MGDAKVSDTFSWSTSKNIEVTIIGLPTFVTVQSTLSISLQDGTRLYSLFHNMSKDLKLSIIVPSETTSLTLKYGSMEYNLKIIGNKAEFSFIPDIPEEIEVP
jgi:archaellum component FlaF (FlaF/FlaG flagellin family)